MHPLITLKPLLHTHGFCLHGGLLFVRMPNIFLTSWQIKGPKKCKKTQRSGQEWKDDRDKRELKFFIADFGYKLMVPSTRELPLWSLDGNLDRLLVTGLQEYWFCSRSLIMR